MVLSGTEKMAISQCPASRQLGGSNDASKVSTASLPQ